ILRDAGVSIAIVLAAVVPLLAASILILFGGIIDRAAIGLFSSDPVLEQVTAWWRLLSRVGRYAVAFGGSVGVTTILYYYGPNRRQRWRLVWRGAFGATVLWLLTTACFGWYVRNMANYNVLYGSVGTSIALLVWMYLMSLIALLGCEFNAEYERLREL
ncbi:MAG: YihY/virulence factor BrkB family protein, partial [Bryobacteraceae bacterium]